MTEEETLNVWALFRTKKGRRILIPWMLGGLMIIIGMQTLPWGIIAIMLGVAIIIYGTYRHFKSSSNGKDDENKDDNDKSKSISKDQTKETKTNIITPTLKK